MIDFLYTLITHSRFLNIVVPIITVLITVIMKIISKSNKHGQLITLQEFAFGFDLYVASLFVLLTKITILLSTVSGNEFHKQLSQISNPIIQDFFQNHRNFEREAFINVVVNNLPPDEAERYINEVFKMYDSWIHLSKISTVAWWYFGVLIFGLFCLCIFIRLFGWDTNKSGMYTKKGIIVQDILGFLVLFLTGYWDF
ncbi:MAG: hypothetical protein F6J92_17340 [Symploca sp. SIO1A3]|nr:hypothetical protein [Symploca sp. SIO1A3]